MEDYDQHKHFDFASNLGYRFQRANEQEGGKLTARFCKRKEDSCSTRQ